MRRTTMSDTTMGGASVTSQATMSEVNRSRVLWHLYRNGVSSRADIAKALGLTPAAMTKITARLIEAGAIEETGGIEGARNRRSSGVRFDAARLHVIGVKFARSLVHIGIFDVAGKLLSCRTLPPVRNDTIDETLRLVHALVNESLDADPSVVAVGSGLHHAGLACGQFHR